MTQTIVRCDEAPIPDKWGKEYATASVLQISRFGSVNQVTLRLQELSDPLAGTLKGKAHDLVSIAAYVYVADQLVSRGGQADIYGKGWHREIAVCLPVTDPEFWNNKRICRLLEQTLDFVSGEVWHFAFCTSKSPAQLSLGEIDEKGIRYNPDSVILFSGGADSLSATVEAVLERGLRPVLVSHRSLPLMSSVQQELVRQLRIKIPSWQFPHSKFVVNKVKTGEKDTTQRTRSFLFVSLGAAVASSIGTRTVILADNGVISLNLPINDQLLGSLASRSTHPQFLSYFNALSNTVLPNQPQISNPLWDRTKAEGLSILRYHDIADLLPATNSCAHRRTLSRDKPLCGVCSQCIDRRFSTIAAALEHFDPAVRYQKDIFLDALDGNALTMVESYIRFFKQIQGLDAETLFLDYPQLNEAIPLDEPNPDNMARRYASMLQRQTNSVIDVVASQVSSASRNLVLEKLPTTCLISLSVQPSEAIPGSALEFQPSEDYRSVRWRGVIYTFTPMQAEVIKVLHKAYKSGNPDLSWEQISQRLNSMERYPQRMRDIFKNSRAWRKLVVQSSKGIYRLANLYTLHPPP